MKKTTRAKNEQNAHSMRFVKSFTGRVASVQMISNTEQQLNDTAVMVDTSFNVNSKLLNQNQKFLEY